MNYYISDLHIGHTNALAFDARPFKTIEENDETIKNNWNSVVGLDDDVYLLGDISWYGSTKTLEYYSQLNGRIHLIKGNHDNKILKNKDLQNLFVEIVDYKELYLNPKRVLFFVIIRFLVLRIITMVGTIYMDMYIQVLKII